MIAKYQFLIDFCMHIAVPGDMSIMDAIAICTAGLLVDNKVKLFLNSSRHMQNLRAFETHARFQKTIENP